MNERSIFAAALDITDPAERAAYLDEACGQQPGLRQHIDELLAAQDKLGSFLAAPPGVLAGTESHEPLREGPGTRIGPYKLLQQIGEGGMGVVYMAEQEEPVRRKVALKIIKPGMDSKQVIARFEAERQALAMMDHQNIAKVFDAGTIGDPGGAPGEPGCVSSGRPYFVMELVHGVPITRFCDDNKLTPRERLALFVPVCQAIQHAHQKGIIHRDVKPSNVLVTMYDDKPVPKVIDFGIAKAIEQRLTEKSLFTQFGALVGTFEYMSPEQAEMNAFGVDTRSDIYSLGVLLYELLTGTTPLERERLRKAALGEVVRLIREEEAPRPSARLSSSGNLPKIAAARKTEPARLSKLVRGEIDWIVMKCLEKDRSRRYDTASGLARDMERYLADEPVEACPPSTRYRLSKFAHKYRKALVTVAAFAVLLIVGMVMTTLLAVWATSAEYEANQQRIASDEARREADRQRIASDDAKREASEAKVEADKQRDEARFTAYVAGMGLAQRYWEEGNVGRARELLDEVPKEAAGRDLRGFEWYYLHRLCHSEALTIMGHALGVWSPDGQRLASAGSFSTSSAGQTVKIWDSATGKELLALKGHTADVASVAFSPDGQRLASGSRDKTVKIWDSATGKELFSLSHAGFVTSVAFSPDGRRLASGGSDNTVKIWDSVTGKELVSLKGHVNPRRDVVLSVAFSPDGQRLASMHTDHTVRIWDSATGKELFTLIHTGQVSSMAFSPDGQRLASVSGMVKIWDNATGKELFSLSHAGYATSVAFSPDGQRLASGIDEGTVNIWDSATGKELLSLKGHARRVLCVAFSPDGQRLVSGSEDKAVKIWDSVTGKELLSLKGHSEGPRSVAFSPDGQRLASGSIDQTVKIWDSDTAKGLFSPKDLRVDSAAFSPDSQRLALANSDNTVIIWDRATGKELATLKGHTDWVFSMAFSPDGQRLASGSIDQTVKIWDSATGKELFSLKINGGRVRSVAFSPDGQRLTSASYDKKENSSFPIETVKIWDSATGKELFSFKGPAGSVAFSPDGQRLASGGGLNDNRVKIWDSATGKELFSLEGHASLVWSVAFSPDGKRLVSGSNDNTVKIWDSATGKELFSLKGHVSGILRVAFSLDGRRLASASFDNRVKIWDSATGKELFSLKTNGGQIKSLAFSPDGQCLASVEGESFVLRETVVFPEMQQRREANALVSDLFKQVGLRADVLKRLSSVHGLSPAVRREALAAARTYPENPVAINDLAWELVKLPGRALADYQKALHYSEAACQLEPKNGDFLNTLGVAHYRLGNYEKALETLLRSDQIQKKKFQGSIPADLAFLAMTQHHLGHAKEAQAELQRLRERMKEPRWAQNAEAQGFLREAEALLAKPKTPDGK